MPVFLVRHARLPLAVRRRTDGPLPGGRFWALDGAHDLPQSCDHGRPYDWAAAGKQQLRCTRKDAEEEAAAEDKAANEGRLFVFWRATTRHLCRVRLSTLLEAGCRVWMQEADAPASEKAWKPVLSEQDVPEVTVRMESDYHTCRDVRVVSPMLEFYVVGHVGGLALPPGWRQKRQQEEATGD